MRSNGSVISLSGSPVRPDIQLFICPILVAIEVVARKEDALKCWMRWSGPVG